MNKKQIKERAAQAWGLLKYNYQYAPKQFTVRARAAYSVKETTKLIRILWQTQKKKKQ